MPAVTVGVQRNNIWSLKCNKHTNLLIPNLTHYSFQKIKEQLTKFQSQKEFTIGLLTFTKKGTDQWFASFPGIPLSFSDWIVSENAPRCESMPVIMTDSDMQTLLEFVVHMFPDSTEQSS
jgi:hypothetical protein